ncbi:signal transduction histidine kinase [Streptomyces sp. Ag109_O5-1]|uniref:sensor histidine kinase n=1 Tax=Streptomyces sp. Ag109_O5-1 TaxID=1938851 RepID=UPI000F4F4852|nr:ATP-binding protein [Streptomyces sp. Ag109_O5-1]RPE45211.1 signal transduction histidine kinase [Streptomyces sp. Ag109_O5-1]
MVSVQPPPNGRELSLARVLLLPAILMAAATAAAVVLVAEPARTAVGVCGAVGMLLVLVTAAEAVRRGRKLRDARAEHARHSAYLERSLAAGDEEIDRLGKEVFPTALYRLKAGESPKEVIRQVFDLDPRMRHAPESQRRLIRIMLDIVDEEDLQRDSLERSFVSVARRVQAIVHQQAHELREMEEDHGRNPEVFDDLLRIDHGTALIGRLADSVSVLGGGRPGRQWPNPVALYSVLRGAMSRILEYRRIELHSICQVNIKGTSVEPLIHAAAELLDNATRYSPPSTKVHVTAVEVQSGVCIEIEDAGVILNEEARARLEGLLEKAKQGKDIQVLGENPRLGLSVVGRLCTTYNMDVSLRASAYGGVRAVLIVPSDMMTTDPAPGIAHGIGATGIPKPELGALEGPKRPPKKRRPTSPRIPAGISMEDDVPEVTEWTAGGLPQRRSRMKMPLSRRLAEQAAIERAEREGTPTVWSQHKEPEPEQPEPERREPGLWVEAFWEGLKKNNPGVHPTDFTRNPTKYLHLINDPAGTEADDEGDLK